MLTEPATLPSPENVHFIGPKFNPCIAPRGPLPAALMILGEAPGQEEERQGLPFVGSSGRELSKMLEEAGLSETQIFMTNVLHTRPRDNKLMDLCLPAKEAENLWKTISPEPYPTPRMKVEGKVVHLHPNLLPEISRLDDEIEKCQPNIIIAMGNTALWALTGRQNISSVRGTILSATLTRKPQKILPTFHPAAILRQWDLRPITVADLIKAGRQASFPEIRRPAREIIVNPTLSDIRAWIRTDLSAARLLAVDIETARGQITCIGFAASPSRALVIPFIKGFQQDFWPTQHEEVSAFRLVREILASPVPKLFQNGLYDLQYIWKVWRTRVANPLHDTMLLHHSLFPEMQKGLGFMGSLYTDEPAWKLMRRKGQTELKRDDE